MGIRKEDYDENGSLSVEKLNKRKSNAHVKSKEWVNFFSLNNFILPHTFNFDNFLKNH